MNEQAFDGGARPDFWLSHVRAGVALTELACALGLVYTLTEPDLENRGPILGLLVGVMACTAAIPLLPLRRILAHPRASWFFYSWSTSAALATAIGCSLDRGSRSPFVSLFFLMMVYAATAYPPQALIRVTALVLVLYAVLAIGDGTRLGAGAFLAGGLALSAWMCSIASRNQWHQLQEQMALARVDGLTGCLNHRAFRELLDAEVVRAHRLGHPLAMLLVDLDEFKQVNDTEGHLVGDALLATMGALLQDSVRRIDSVGRVGGDEFAVLLLETDLAHAVEVGERICEAARSLDGDTRSTVSVGVARLSADETAVALLRDADVALYDAKRSGRDRVRSEATGSA